MFKLKHMLADDLSNLFKDNLFQTPDGKERKINVFCDAPPIHDDGSNEDDDFDWIVVQASEGSRNGQLDPEEIKARLIVGVFDEDYHYAGADTRDILLRQIIDHYDQHPTLGSEYRYLFDGQFANADEDTWPRFFGAVEMTFERPTMIEESPYV